MGEHDLPNESELALRAATDASAFSALYDFYFPRVWSYVIKRVGHTQTSEDLVSQIFLKVTEALPRRQNNAPFGAWVFRIATNTLIDHYRAHARRRDQELDDAHALIDHGPGPDEMAEARTAFRELEKIMAELPERDRRIINLKFFAGLNNREISEVEKIKENNVGVIVYRALERIRKQSQFYGKSE